MRRLFVVACLWWCGSALKSSVVRTVSRRSIPPIVAGPLLSLVGTTTPAVADEVFAPNARCSKRGVLGKCLDDAEVPDPQFRPEAMPEKGGGRLLAADAETSPLVERLLRQTEENKLKNQRDVEIKSFANSQSGIVGPFSRFDVIQKSNGESFVLVPARDVGDLEKQNKIQKGRFLNDNDAKPYETKRAPDNDTKQQEKND